MNQGLPQGFVRFGSGAHRVLVALHEHGDLRHSDLVEELGLPDDIVSNVLNRLARFKFIWPAGKVGKYETGEKTQMRWSLVHRRMVGEKFQPVSATERKARHRAMVKRRVASVWEFRP